MEKSLAISGSLGGAWGWAREGTLFFGRLGVWSAVAFRGSFRRALAPAHVLALARHLLFMARLLLLLYLTPKLNEFTTRNQPPRCACCTCCACCAKAGRR